MKKYKNQGAVIIIITIVVVVVVVVFVFVIIIIIIIVIIIFNHYSNTDMLFCLCVRVNYFMIKPSGAGIFYFCNYKYLADYFWYFIHFENKLLGCLDTDFVHIKFSEYHHDLQHFHIIVVALEAIFCTEFVDMTVILIHTKRHLPVAVVLGYGYLKMNFCIDTVKALLSYIISGPHINLRWCRSDLRICDFREVN